MPSRGRAGLLRACRHCDIGCKAQAKNTLDLNHLAVAEDRGAEIRPLAMVSPIAAESAGYAVVYHDLTGGRRVERVVRARQVIVAAGSLGTTELLFRSRDGFGTLPHVSAALGLHWSSNGDFLTPAFYDGSEEGAQCFVEDGGFPEVPGNALRAVRDRRTRLGLVGRTMGRFAERFSDGDPLETMMPWFGQAIDGGDGRLYRGRDWMRPWNSRLKLDWNPARSEHGAGVVDHRGEVFGHPGLFVADGAIVPRSIGLNPSTTIAALAERSAALMIDAR